MPTITQLIRKKRKLKNKPIKTRALERCPQKKGECEKVYIVSPKKPNSAKRKVARVLLRNNKVVIAYIPGEGNNTLETHSIVLVRGGRVKDLPGIKYHIIRGKYSLKSVSQRKQARSKYGTKNTNKS